MFDYLGPCLRRVGCIEATKVEDQNGGAVERITNTLKNEKKVLLLISPKGTIIKREWRSGYFFLAQNLSADLVAIGPDYERKKMCIGTPVSYTCGEPFVKEWLYNDLSKIVPLYPECEMMPIRKHNKYNISIINYKPMIGIGFVCYLIYYLYNK